MRRLEPDRTASSAIRNLTIRSKKQNVHKLISEKIKNDVTLQHTENFLNPEISSISKDPNMNLLQLLRTCSDNTLSDIDNLSEALKPKDIVEKILNSDDKLLEESLAAKYNKENSTTDTLEPNSRHSVTRINKLYEASTDTGITYRYISSELCSKYRDAVWRDEHTGGAEAAAREKLKTGIDAVIYFSRFRNDSETKFVYCKRDYIIDNSGKPTRFQEPYELSVVPKRPTTNEFYAVFSKKVVKFSATEPTESVPISSWVFNCSIIRLLKKFNFFKYYLAKKVLGRLFHVHKQNYFSQCRERFRSNFVFFKPIVKPHYFKIRDICRDITGTSLISIPPAGTSVTLEEFCKSQILLKSGSSGAHTKITNLFEKLDECIQNMITALHSSINEIDTAQLEKPPVKIGPSLRVVKDPLARNELSFNMINETDSDVSNFVSTSKTNSVVVKSIQWQAEQNKIRQHLIKIAQKDIRQISKLLRVLVEFHRESLIKILINNLISVMALFETQPKILKFQIIFEQNNVFISPEKEFIISEFKKIIESAEALISSLPTIATLESCNKILTSRFHADLIQPQDIGVSYIKPTLNEITFADYLNSIRPKKRNYLSYFPRYKTVNNNDYYRFDFLKISSKRNKKNYSPVIKMTRECLYKESNKFKYENNYKQINHLQGNGYIFSPINDLQNEILDDCINGISENGIYHSYKRCNINYVPSDNMKKLKKNFEINTISGNKPSIEMKNKSLKSHMLSSSNFFINREQDNSYIFSNCSMNKFNNERYNTIENNQKLKKNRNLIETINKNIFSNNLIFAESCSSTVQWPLERHADLKTLKERILNRLSENITELEKLSKNRFNPFHEIYIFDLQWNEELYNARYILKPVELCTENINFVSEEFHCAPLFAVDIEQPTNNTQNFKPQGVPQELTIFHSFGSAANKLDSTAIVTFASKNFSTTTHHSLRKSRIALYEKLSILKNNYKLLSSKHDPNIYRQNITHIDTKCSHLSALSEVQSRKTNVFNEFIKLKPYISKNLQKKKKLYYFKTNNNDRKEQYLKSYRVKSNLSINNISEFIFSENSVTENIKIDPHVIHGSLDYSCVKLPALQLIRILASDLAQILRYEQDLQELKPQIVVQQVLLDAQPLLSMLQSCPSKVAAVIRNKMSEIAHSAATDLSSQIDKASGSLATNNIWDLVEDGKLASQSTNPLDPTEVLLDHPMKKRPNTLLSILLGPLLEAEALPAIATADIALKAYWGALDLESLIEEKANIDTILLTLKEMDVKISIEDSVLVDGLSVTFTTIRNELLPAARKIVEKEKESVLSSLITTEKNITILADSLCEKLNDQEIWNTNDTKNSKFTDVQNTRENVQNILLKARGCEVIREILEFPKEKLKSVTILNDVYLSALTCWQIISDSNKIVEQYESIIFNSKDFQNCTSSEAARAVTTCINIPQRLNIPNWNRLIFQPIDDIELLSLAKKARESLISLMMSIPRTLEELQKFKDLQWAYETGTPMQGGLREKSRISDIQLSTWNIDIMKRTHAISKLTSSSGLGDLANIALTKLKQIQEIIETIHGIYWFWEDWDEFCHTLKLQNDVSLAEIYNGDTESILTVCRKICYRRRLQRSLLDLLILLLFYLNTVPLSSPLSSDSHQCHPILINALDALVQNVHTIGNEILNFSRSEDFIDCVKPSLCIAGLEYLKQISQNDYNIPGAPGASAVFNAIFRIIRETITFVDDSTLQPCFGSIIQCILDAAASARALSMCFRAQLWMARTLYSAKITLHSFVEKSDNIDLNQTLIKSSARNKPVFASDLYPDSKIYNITNYFKDKNFEEKTLDEAKSLEKKINSDENNQFSKSECQSYRQSIESNYKSFLSYEIFKYSKKNSIGLFCKNQSLNKRGYPLIKYNIKSRSKTYLNNGFCFTEYNSDNIYQDCLNSDDISTKTIMNHNTPLYSGGTVITGSHPIFDELNKYQLKFSGSCTILELAQWSNCMIKYINITLLTIENVKKLVISHNIPSPVIATYNEYLSSTALISLETRPGITDPSVEEYASAIVNNSEMVENLIKTKNIQLIDKEIINSIQIIINAAPQTLNKKEIQTWANIILSEAHFWPSTAWSIVSATENWDINDMSNYFNLQKELSIRIDLSTIVYSIMQMRKCGILLKSKFEHGRFLINIGSKNICINPGSGSPRWLYPNLFDVLYRVLHAPYNKIYCIDSISSSRLLDTLGLLLGSASKCKVNKDKYLLDDDRETKLYIPLPLGPLSINIVQLAPMALESPGTVQLMNALTEFRKYPLNIAKTQCSYISRIAPLINISRLSEFASDTTINLSTTIFLLSPSSLKNYDMYHIHNIDKNYTINGKSFSNEDSSSDFQESDKVTCTQELVRLWEVRLSTVVGIFITAKWVASASMPLTVLGNYSPQTFDSLVYLCNVNIIKLSTYDIMTRGIEQISQSVFTSVGDKELLIIIYGGMSVALSFQIFTHLSIKSYIPCIILDSSTCDNTKIYEELGLPLVKIDISVPSEEQNSILNELPDSLKILIVQLKHLIKTYLKQIIPKNHYLSNTDTMSHILYVFLRWLLLDSIGCFLEKNQVNLNLSKTEIIRLSAIPVPVIVFKYIFLISLALEPSLQISLTNKISDLFSLNWKGSCLTYATDGVKVINILDDDTWLAKLKASHFQINKTNDINNINEYTLNTSNKDRFINLSTEVSFTKPYLFSTDTESLEPPLISEVNTCMVKSNKYLSIHGIIIEQSLMNKNCLKLHDKSSNLRYLNNTNINEECVFAEDSNDYSNRITCHTQNTDINNLSNLDSMSCLSFEKANFSNISQIDKDQVDAKNNCKNMTLTNELLFKQSSQHILNKNKTIKTDIDKNHISEQQYYDTQLSSDRDQNQIKLNLLEHNTDNTEFQIIQINSETKCDDTIDIATSNKSESFYDGSPKTFDNLHNSKSSIICDINTDVIESQSGKNMNTSCKNTDIMYRILNDVYYENIDPTIKYSILLSTELVLESIMLQLQHISTTINVHASKLANVYGLLQCLNKYVPIIAADSNPLNSSSVVIHTANLKIPVTKAISDFLIPNKPFSDWDLIRSFMQDEQHPTETQSTLSNKQTSNHFSEKDISVEENFLITEKYCKDNFIVGFFPLFKSQFTDALQWSLPPAPEIASLTLTTDKIFRILSNQNLLKITQAISLPELSASPLDILTQLYYHNMIDSVFHAGQVLKSHPDFSDIKELECIHDPKETLQRYITEIDSIQTSDLDLTSISSNLDFKSFSDAIKIINSGYQKGADEILLWLIRAMILLQNRPFGCVLIGDLNHNDISALATLLNRSLSLTLLHPNQYGSKDFDHASVTYLSKSKNTLGIVKNPSLRAASILQNHVILQFTDINVDFLAESINMSPHCFLRKPTEVQPYQFYAPFSASRAEEYCAILRTVSLFCDIPLNKLAKACDMIKKRYNTFKNSEIIDTRGTFADELMCQSNYKKNNNMRCKEIKFASESSNVELKTTNNPNKFLLATNSRGINIGSQLSAIDILKYRIPILKDMDPTVWKALSLIIDHCPESICRALATAVYLVGSNNGSWADSLILATEEFVFGDGSKLENDSNKSSSNTDLCMIFTELSSHLQEISDIALKCLNKHRNDFILSYEGLHVFPCSDHGSLPGYSTIPAINLLQIDVSQLKTPTYFTDLDKLPVLDPVLVARSAMFYANVPLAFSSTWPPLNTNGFIVVYPHIPDPWSNIKSNSTITNKAHLAHMLAGVPLQIQEPDLTQIEEPYHRHFMDASKNWFHFNCESEIINAYNTYESAKEYSTLQCLLRAVKFLLSARNGGCLINNKYSNKNPPSPSIVVSMIRTSHLPALARSALLEEISELEIYENYSSSYNLSISSLPEINSLQDTINEYVPTRHLSYFLTPAINIKKKEQSKVSLVDQLLSGYTDIFLNTQDHKAEQLIALEVFLLHEPHQSLPHYLFSSLPGFLDSSGLKEVNNIQGTPVQDGVSISHLYLIGAQNSKVGPVWTPLKEMVTVTFTSRKTTEKSNNKNLASLDHNDDFNKYTRNENQNTKANNLRVLLVTHGIEKVPKWTMLYASDTLADRYHGLEFLLLRDF